MRAIELEVVKTGRGNLVVAIEPERRRQRVRRRRRDGTRMLAVGEDGVLRFHPVVHSGMADAKFSDARLERRRGRQKRIACAIDDVKVLRRAVVRRTAVGCDDAVAHLHPLLERIAMRQYGKFVVTEPSGVIRERGLRFRLRQRLSCEMAPRHDQVRPRVGRHEDAEPAREEGGDRSVRPPAEDEHRTLTEAATVRGDGAEYRDHHEQQRTTHSHRLASSSARCQSSRDQRRELKT